MALMEQEPIAHAHCKAMRKNGEPCKGKANGNGYCMVHSPTRRFNAAEIGRKGGRKSATSRRARRDLAAGRPVTELLREAFESDEAWLAAAVDAYRAGVSEGKPMDRVSVTNDLLARCYGKPQQLVQTKSDTTITVVSRLGAALERAHSDVTLDDASVRELESGDPT